MDTARLKTQWAALFPSVENVVTLSVFLRLLGLVFFVAIASFAVQADGLIGPKGILPLDQFMDAAARQIPEGEHFSRLPSLTWFGHSPAFVHGLCIAGLLLSLALMAGLLPGPCLFGLWLIYLSLSLAGQTFYSFQWDTLLLEAGFLGIFIAPLSLRMSIRNGAPPCRLAVWLLRLLLFKLMFCSGVVKLSSGDETWRTLSAMTYHYETTCLPLWTSWYMHHLPLWMHKLETLSTFGVELIVPFFIFGPRRFRIIAFWIFTALQLIIASTGNYAFFNLLSWVLAISLLDDQAFPLNRIKGSKSAVRPWMQRITWFAAVLYAVPYLLITSIQIAGSFRVQVQWPKCIGHLHSSVAPYRTINGYGLFASMTTSRPEIIIEGSRDGSTWIPYEFKWKAGRLDQRPRLAAPYQPRLDWQMWFAALGDYRGNRWFLNFMIRLMEGSEDVLEQLKENPFPEKPPRFLRAVKYDYTYTSPEERRETGNWWKREELGLYCPVLQRQ
jgi:hypothetical protein